MDLSAFSESYEEARAKFLQAAGRHGLPVASYEHTEQRGPAGEQLFMDVARFGPVDARHVLVVGSGTHGIEGYSGSAAQTHWLNHHEPASLPDGVAVLFFHAHNPWGFAHALRFTEDNVDLNRNFVDFTQPLPPNPGYAQVHALLDYKEWNDGVVANSFVQFDALRERIGEQAFSDAFNGGQYTHADGIFYGGQRAQWSNETFRRAVREHLTGVQASALIDLHTGIGPERGHVFLCFHQPESPAYERARQWWGDKAVNREGVTHKAVARYQGLLVDSFVDMQPSVKTTAVVVEFGTLPRPKMQRASMGARWLWVSREQEQEPTLRERLMREVREAFYPSAPDWRIGILKQSEEIFDRAIDGLGQA